MLFVTIMQALGVALVITSVSLDELMVSPEKNGVNCTLRPFNSHNYSVPITTTNLRVYWGWANLLIRWNYGGSTDIQIWVSETYHQQYDLRCDSTPAPTSAPTHLPPPPSICSFVFFAFSGHPSWREHGADRYTSAQCL